MTDQLRPVVSGGSSLHDLRVEGNTAPPMDHRGMVSQILVNRQSKWCSVCQIRPTNYLVHIGRSWYRQCWKCIEPEAVTLLAGLF